jgi:D-amino peptidase
VKILIAADMEGISGVVSWNQVDPGHSEYSRFRKIMTQDVNAAVSGAFEGGASEVLVADGHAYAMNILIEELDPRAHLTTGQFNPHGMLQGIGDDIQGVLFVGYHARAGTQNAILDHTWSSMTVSNLWLNDVLVGETGLNAAVCGHFGAPVLMVSGDQSVCKEAADLLGEIETAVVKNACGRNAAECLPLAASQEIIYEKAARAVSRLVSGEAPPPFRVSTPVRVAVDLISADMADRASALPGSNRESGRRIVITSEDMLSALNAFQSIVGLARPLKG